MPSEAHRAKEGYAAKHLIEATATSDWRWGDTIVAGEERYMTPGSYRFPLEIIRHAVWLYHRSSLSVREVEDLLAERGITASYEDETS